MRCLLLLGLCGCELYFSDGPQNITPALDASTASLPVASRGCPDDPPPDGLVPTITSPTNGATNITWPLQILWHWSNAQQDARKLGWLYDPYGEQVWGDYQIPCPQPTTGPDKASCYEVLKPNTTYTFKMGWLCYASGSMVEMATSSFTTAP